MRARLWMLNPTHTCSPLVKCMLFECALATCLACLLTGTVGDVSRVEKAPLILCAPTPSVAQRMSLAKNAISMALQAMLFTEGVSCHFAPCVSAHMLTRCVACSQGNGSQ